MEPFVPTGNLGHGAVMASAVEVGDLVWAKGKKNIFWPGRVADPGHLVKPGNQQDAVFVTRFGSSSGGAWCQRAQVRPFFSVDIDEMAGQRRGSEFTAAVEAALGFVAICLESDLSCPCFRPERAAAQEKIGAENLSPVKFLDHLRSAACNASSTDLLQRVKMMSWVSAFGTGWTGSEVKCHRRCSSEELVDKFDLDATPGDSAEDGDVNMKVGKVQKVCRKKRASLSSDDDAIASMATDAGDVMPREEEDIDQSSVKRERKKSKYLSPPYTNLKGLLKVPLVPQSPKSSEKKVAGSDSNNGKACGFHGISLMAILSTLHFVAEDLVHAKQSRSSVKSLTSFLSLFRSAVFIEGSEYGVPKCNCHVGFGQLGSCSGVKAVGIEHQEPEVKSIFGEAGAIEKSVNKINIEKTSAQTSPVPRLAACSIKEVMVNAHFSPHSVENGRSDKEALSSGAKSMARIGYVLKAQCEELTRQTRKKRKRQSNSNVIPSNSDHEMTGSSEAGNSFPPTKESKAGDQFSNPAALLIDFGPGIALPSKDDVLLTFSKYGLLVEPETEVQSNVRCVRIVFARSADAEMAYSNSNKLGIFGPPFATSRLHYLPPVKLDRSSKENVLAPPAAVKPPLSDIRKNLEMMISSLHGTSLNLAGPKPAGASLLGEMQGLLAKVDRVLVGSEKLNKVADKALTDTRPV